MTERKKRIAALTLSVMIVFLMAGVAIAYLGKKEDRVNTMEIGTNTEEIVETFAPPEVVRMTDNLTEKRVTVKNTGNVDCFARVYAEFSDSSVAGKSRVKNTGTNSADTNYYTWLDFKELLKEDSNYISPDWQFIPLNSEENEALRGYFYYKKVLKPDGETAPLFTYFVTDFTGDPTDRNIDKITDYEIIVYSETVQSTEVSDGTVFTDDEWLTAWKSFLKVPVTP